MIIILETGWALTDDGSGAVVSLVGRKASTEGGRSVDAVYLAQGATPSNDRLVWRRYLLPGGAAEGEFAVTDTVVTG
jgi:hypothetical protein